MERCLLGKDLVHLGYVKDAVQIDVVAEVSQTPVAIFLKERLSHSTQTIQPALSHVVHPAHVLYELGVIGKNGLGDRNVPGESARVVGVDPYLLQKVEAAHSRKCQHCKERNADYRKQMSLHILVFSSQAARRRLAARPPRARWARMRMLGPALSKT